MAKKVAHKQAKPIDLEVRKERGSRRTQILRASGRLPGVVYGMGKDALSISLPFVEVVNVLQSGSHILEVMLEGKHEKMLIQDVQYDYLQTTAEHVDLMRIDPNQRVTVRVNLEFRGVAKGTKEGGVLEMQTSEIELEVLALAIPDTIRVNVENLELHQMIHAKDIALPEGATLIDALEKIICQVRTVKEEVAAEAGAAGAAEPEVIGKKKEEEGADAAAPAKGGAKAAAPAKK